MCANSQTTNYGAIYDSPVEGGKLLMDKNQADVRSAKRTGRHVSKKFMTKFNVCLQVIILKSLACVEGLYDNGTRNFDFVDEHL